MSRRRRQKNPLLFRMFGISLVVILASLVVAAQLGLFNPVKAGPGVSRVVLINQADTPKEKPKQAEKKKEAQKTAPQKRAASANAHPTSANHTNLLQPKVISSGPAGGDGSGPVAAPGGNLTPGAIPTETKPKVEEKQPKVDSPPINHVDPVVTPIPTPTNPESTKPATKPDLVFVDCEPLVTESPVIPDDLRTANLDKDYIAEIVVDPSGTPSKVKTFQSTGIQELDDLALAAAKHWKFKPASLGGAPTEQVVHLKVEFRVE